MSIETYILERQYLLSRVNETDILQHYAKIYKESVIYTAGTKKIMIPYESIFNTVLPKLNCFQSYEKEMEILGELIAELDSAIHIYISNKIREKNTLFLQTSVPTAPVLIIGELDMKMAAKYVALLRDFVVDVSNLTIPVKMNVAVPAIPILDLKNKSMEECADKQSLMNAEIDAVNSFLPVEQYYNEVNDQLEILEKKMRKILNFIVSAM